MANWEGVFNRKPTRNVTVVKAGLTQAVTLHLERLRLTHFISSFLSFEVMHCWISSDDSLLCVCILSKVADFTESEHGKRSLINERWCQITPLTSEAAGMKQTVRGWYLYSLLIFKDLMPSIFVHTISSKICGTLCVKSLRKNKKNLWFFFSLRPPHQTLIESLIWSRSLMYRHICSLYCCVKRASAVWAYKWNQRRVKAKHSPRSIFQ